MRATGVPRLRGDLRLRAYWLLLVAGMRTQSAYPLATFAGLVANATFGLLKTAILFAVVEAAGGGIAGYTAGTMSAYIWLSQGLLGSVNLYGRSDMTERVRTGDVATDFLRPVNVQAANILPAIGKGLFAFVPRGLPSIVIGVLVVGMTMPATPGPYVLGTVSMVLGIVLSHSVVYLVAVSGFWLVETRGFVGLYMAVGGLFAGLFTPFHLFPDWLQVIGRATPFPSMMMFPIDVLTARVTGFAALQVVGVQLAWLAGALAVGHLMTRAGQRKLEVQGG
ncbi:ABC transporter permease [Antribacter gilvus]|uniref:ABC transporter permease n=1 Tax=Antribacter gilvus TaxID=2304675 RepID=UPI001F0B7F6A|nr:ABC-2 family transporter protein [Antribacter gilvus]